MDSIVGVVLNHPVRVVLLGIVIGIFYGLQSWVVLPHRADLSKIPQDKRWMWGVHDLFVHVLGTTAGSFCLLVFFGTSRDWESPAFSVQDLILFIIVLLGLSGFLPELFWGVASSFERLIKKVLDKIRD